MEQKTAQLIYGGGNGEPKLVRLIHAKKTFGDNLSEVKKCKLLNLDGKSVLEYEEKFAKKNGKVYKLASYIHCYEHFFVRMQVAEPISEKEGKKYAYQAYDYDGRGLYCDSDIWLGDDEMIAFLNEKAQNRTPSNSDEEKSCN